MNIKSATAEFFKASGRSYVSPAADNTRLWVHDALHTLLDCPETYKNEFIVSIYQAVLMDTPYVGTGFKSVEGIALKEVSFDDIMQSVLPGVEQFLVAIEQKHGLTVNRAERLEPEEVRYFYDDARFVKQAIEARFGKAFRDIPADDFLGQDFADIKALFAPLSHQDAAEICSLVQTGVEL